MRAIFNATLMVCVAAVLVVLLAWGLSFPIGWLFGLEKFHALALSLGVLGILTMVSHLLSTAPRVEHTSFPDEEDEEESEEGAEKEEKESLPGWFRPCPCESGKPFNHCCGRKAYLRKGSVLQGWRENK